jgi:hypothetical protein
LRIVSKWPQSGRADATDDLTPPGPFVRHAYDRRRAMLRCPVH